MRRTRILLADDHMMIGAAFQKLLEPQYEVVGCVGDGRALLKAAADLRPDLVLLDVGMPLLNGLDAGRELKKLTPSVKLIFLTMNPDPDVASEAFRIGASGYVLKTSQKDELLEAVHNAAKGISYVTPQVRHAIEQKFIRDPKSLGRPKDLTDRQVETLQLLAEAATEGDCLHPKYLGQNCALPQRSDHGSVGNQQPSRTRAVCDQARYDLLAVGVQCTDGVFTGRFSWPSYCPK